MDWWSPKQVAQSTLLVIVVGIVLTLLILSVDGVFVEIRKLLLNRANF